jgi:hypothetical protein
MAIGENSPCFEFIYEYLGKDLVGVEIGIWDGGNAEAVLNYIQPRIYFMIDPYKEFKGSSKKQEEFDRTYEEMCKKFSYYPGVIIMRKTSVEAAPGVVNNLDFVYVDGDHSYDMKMKDMETWYPKIRPGGVLCGDDYNLMTTKKVVKDFCQKHNLEFDYSENSDPHPPEFWIIKPAGSYDR